MNIIEIEFPGFMGLAKKIADSSQERFKLGSVLAKSGRVISRGVNKYANVNKLSKKYFVYETIHSEISALNGISEEIVKGGILYVFRMKRNGDIGNSKPCRSCMNAIRDLKVKKIVYTIEVFPYFKEEWI